MSGARDHGMPPYSDKAHHEGRKVALHDTEPNSKERKALVREHIDKRIDAHVEKHGSIGGDKLAEFGQMEKNLNEAKYRK